MLKIHQPHISRHDQTVRLNSLLTHKGGSETLWYAVDKSQGDSLTLDRLDGFLVGMLLFAMKRGEDIYIDGPISEKLFYNLSHYFIKILTLLIPSLHPINIIPKQLESDALQGSLGEVATGFSGGIDSFAVLADHLWGDVPASYRITHLVFNNVGSHGHGGRELFHKRYARLVKFANEVELPFIKIDSNLDNILDMEFRTTHTTRNVSAILALQSLFGKYFYASAHKYENCFVGEAKDGSVIDPSALHLLSTETTEIISTGCQYSRVDKTTKVSNLEASYRYLDVCVDTIDTPENCSTCWKCARTLLTLEILGKQQLYNQVFDLTKFKTFRDSYIDSIQDSPAPLEQEIIQLAVQCEYSLGSNVPHP